ncbi:type II toxin-antitoxin system death-on-curing family toxin [Methyloglobulus sp.]|uniref:type II toxin-antitoxin system death-on-curing family toxin n=1 Tax=Methyloglobulus sp. TaxID=2518622 RepID=UPI0032B73BE4
MTGIIWITESDTILIHERLLALNGGAAGILDRGLLQSALARPQQLHNYGNNPAIIDLAASYIMGIVKNHPFVDGNKRVGFGVGILFLEMNGHAFTASATAVADTILAVASSDLDEDGLRAFLKENNQ